tara:strand:- start:35 stop:2668 length:2634 start_codon:yes stop_codon:yes gene_type:complete
MKIKTANTSYIGLPICPASFFNTSTVNITIDWGDSTTESFSSLSDPNITQVKDGSSNVIANIFRHSYLSAGNYTITISGGFGSSGEEKLAFCQQSQQSNGVAENISESLAKASLSKIIEIEDTSNFYIHGQGDFKGFTNLTKIQNGASALLSDAPSSSIVLSSNGSATMLMDKTFEDCSSLTEINFTPESITSCQKTFKNSSYSPSKLWKLNQWDMSEVVSTRGMFEGSAFNAYIYSWDLAKVEDASLMFKDTTAFNQHVKPLFEKDSATTYALKNTSSMFEGAEEFNKPLWNWDMTTVENASLMFKNAKKFNDASVHTFFKSDTSVSYAITGLASMFEGAELFNQNLWKWDMTTVTDASSMFKNATAFNGWIRPFLEKSNGTSYQLTTCSSMFEGANAYNQSVSTWDMTTVENASAMFKNAEDYNRYMGSWFDSSDSNSITDVSSMFEGANSFNSSIQTWDATTIEDASSMFKNNSVIQNGLYHLFKKDSSKTYALKNVSSMFEGTDLFDGDISSWDMTVVENTSSMFKNTKVFNRNVNSLFKKDALISYKVTNMSSMFEGAEKFNKTLWNWDVSTVEDASTMFKDTKVFNLPLNTLFQKDDNISYALKNTSSMFEGAEAFNAGNLANWDMTTVENTSSMFKNTKVFNKDIQAWFSDQSTNYALVDASSMFEGSEAFNKHIRNWNMVSVQNVNSMFKNSKAFNKPLIKWFKKDSSKTYSITNMGSMFEGSIFNQDLSGPDSDSDAGWDTSTVENMSSMFKNISVTLDYSVDRVLQRAVNAGTLKKSKDFLYGTNVKKGFNDTHSSKFSATASLSSNVLTINATLVGNYDYWSYKVVNTNTQSFASVSEVLVQNGDTSVDITLDPGSYEIYAKGYIS